MTKQENEEVKKGIDYLKEDPLIAGQKFALVSMVEPDKNKVLDLEMFYIARFMQHTMTEYAIAREYMKKNPEKKIEPEFASRTNLSFKNVRTMYSQYLSQNANKLQAEYNDKYNEDDLTVITGIKIRGVFSAQKQMKKKITELHALEPAVDIWVAPIGRWVPYCSKGYDGITEEYAENKLNNIMKEKVVAQHDEEKIFEERRQQKLSLFREEKEETKNDNDESDAKIISN